MEDIIKLRSGYKAVNYLKKMPKTDVPTLRVGEVGGVCHIHKFINPSEGPIIIEGQELEEAKAVVKSIDFVEGYGWTITFE
jgi:hypothetical protein